MVANIVRHVKDGLSSPSSSELHSRDVVQNNSTFWFDNAWYGCEAGGLTARGGVFSVSDVDELQPEDAIFDSEECGPSQSGEQPERVFAAPAVNEPYLVSSEVSGRAKGRVRHNRLADGVDAVLRLLEA
ncbi:hypothetical protein HPB50_012904 [Hyalomma asiaticum]|uniref:Uncharacterized protein n=1 Tax=Hyalomma asiaticum TaxID=266040 RepID=A0ACB7T2B2_HYAAI|nr:hypothetical protein HPB50_012904 [Hyalomma asiaticum]